MSEAVCIVCSKPLDEDRALCHTCGHDFHLALRTDRPAKDCGDAWIDDDSQALIFGCNRCLTPAATVPGRTYRVHHGVPARELARTRRDRVRKGEK